MAEEMEADEELDKEEIKMWEIIVFIQDGENEYEQGGLYYLGTEADANRYAESYMNDYFGSQPGDTTWDDHDECWYSENDRQAARYGVYPFERIVAMTEKGTLQYEMEFRVK